MCFHLSIPERKGRRVWRLGEARLNLHAIKRPIRKREMVGSRGRRRRRKWKWGFGAEEKEDLETHTEREQKQGF